MTWHPEHATAVLSIWNGDVCTSTFQLPIDEAPRLIAHLAEGLSSAMSHDVGVALSPIKERESWASRLRGAIADVIARFR